MTRLPPLALLLALLLAACAAPTGSLGIAVSGLPAGLDASVTVTGPGNYRATVRESTTLSGLMSGTYAVTAGTVTTTAVVREYEATITPSTVAVVAAQTATVDVAYAVTGGILTVAVSGLPVGVAADVSVGGPDGFAQALTETATLTDLTPGEYSASALGVSAGTDRYSPTVTGSPAEVSSAIATSIEVAYTLDPGALEVTIGGLPGGVDADVLVEGPDGFSTTLTSTTTETDLVPGVYTVTAASVRDADPIVSRMYGATSVAPSIVEVVSRATATVSLSFAVVPSSGRLWVPHRDTTITAGFSASDLSTTGSPTPAAILTGASDFREGLAFDAAGNAWIPNLDAGTVERYSVSQLAGDGSPIPGVAMGGLSGPVGAAFDASGNLFVANLLSDTVAMFTPDQLLLGGSPTPAVTLSSTGGSLDGPGGLAFDASGALWVSNQNADTVVRFGASQLLVSGSPVPEATIGDDGSGDLERPFGLAFDASGDLWVANIEGPDAVLRFSDPGALSGSVDPTAAATLTGVTNPIGLAFDNSGSLWVVSTVTTDLYRFDAPGALSGAVSPAANASIAGVAAIDVGFISFFPPAEGLPIATP